MIHQNKTLERQAYEQARVHVMAGIDEGVWPIYVAAHPDDIKILHSVEHILCKHNHRNGTTPGVSDYSISFTKTVPGPIPSHNYKKTYKVWFFEDSSQQRGRYEAMSHDTAFVRGLVPQP